MTKLMLKGTFSLTKVLLFNLGTLKKLRQLDPSKIYVRPKPSYKLPKYKPGMKFCDSDEKYLRPTLYCNCRAPEVIAMANELGAFKKSDYEFAESAFEFVKRKIILEMLPMDDVANVLRRGTGTCLHEISLFIALCRAAGIKARYKLYALTMIQQWYDALVAPDPLMKKWYDAMGYFMMHGEGEVYIDGKWLPADVGPTPERQAAAGIPITKFGEDSIGVWFHALPGTIMRLESLPLTLGFSSKILMKKIAPSSVAKINASILQQIERGRKIIEEAGGEESYDKMARRKRGPEIPKLKVEYRKDKISFEEK
jgi:hypothetical protein